MKEYDCGFTRDNKWFRYRAAAIIDENNCVLFAGNELEDYPKWDSLFFFY